VEAHLATCFERNWAGRYKRDANGNKLLGPLEYFKDGNGSKKNVLAPSVVRENLKKWLMSTQGREWQEVRAKFLTPASDSASE
jgi:hypothetical protein